MACVESGPARKTRELVMRQTRKPSRQEEIFSVIRDTQATPTNGVSALIT